MRSAATFRTAVETGDTQALQRPLVEDAVLYTDGGGKRSAALNPISGATISALAFDWELLRLNRSSDQRYEVIGPSPRKGCGDERRRLTGHKETSLSSRRPAQENRD